MAWYGRNSVCSYSTKDLAMTKTRRIYDIEGRWKAFKHWTERQMIRESNDTLYSDSAGPDIEWLIARVRKLEKVLKKAPNLDANAFEALRPISSFCHEYDSWIVDARSALENDGE